MTKYLLQFDGRVVGLPECLASEEVGRSVAILLQNLPFVFLCHGSKLLQVADHQQLHASERHISVLIASQHFVDGVKQVTANHRNLVDDEQVECAKDVDLVLRIGVFRFLFASGNILSWQVKTRRQLEE